MRSRSISFQPLDGVTGSGFGLETEVSEVSEVSVGSEFLKIFFKFLLQVSLGVAFNVIEITLMAKSNFDSRRCQIRRSLVGDHLLGLSTVLLTPNIVQKSVAVVAS